MPSGAQSSALSLSVYICDDPLCRPCAVRRKLARRRALLIAAAALGALAFLLSLALLVILNWSR